MTCPASAVSFTEMYLVPNAGLLPAAALAQLVGLGGLVDQRLRLAGEGADSGSKALTVIGSMLVGGDSIDDTAVLRAGAVGSLFVDTRAPSTVGSWLWAHQSAVIISRSESRSSGPRRNGESGRMHSCL